MKRTTLLTVAALAFVAACGDGNPTQVVDTPGDLGPLFLENSAENIVTGGACMGDDALAGGRTSGMQSASNLNCTANDVSLAVATITEYSTVSETGPFTAVNGPVTCTEGTDIWVKTTANLVTNATERYDVGIWLPDLTSDPEQEPGNAVTGRCRQWNLLNGSAGGATNLDADQCGDVSSANATAASPTTQDLGTLKLKCEDVDPNFPGQLAVGACLGWNNNRSGSLCPLNGTDAINFRYGTTPETKSKCNCDPMLLPITVVQTGSIELTKVWSGTPGQTTLQIGTTAGGSDVASQLTGADGGAPLTTGAQIVNTGTYYVSETGGLDDYSSTLACTRDGTAFTPGASNSVSVASGDVVVCTFTNTRNTGSIELKKAWVGTGDQVTLKIGTTAGGSEVDSQLTGADGGAPLTTGTNTVDTGTYYVSESGLSSDYSASLACTRNGTAFTPGASNSVSVGTNDVVVCTFTNTLVVGSLRIQKQLDGSTSLGSASFTFAVEKCGAGSSASSCLSPVAITGSPFTVNSGNNPLTIGSLPVGFYQVTETNGSGYVVLPGLVQIVEVTAGATVTVTFNNVPITDVCEDGKPSELYLLYTGNADANVDGDPDAGHDQTSDEVIIEYFNMPWPTSGLTIKTYDHTGKLLDTFSPVEVGTQSAVITFKNKGNKLIPPRALLEVFNGSTLLERVQFHTSCSQPLSVGDEFGSFLVIGDKP